MASYFIVTGATRGVGRALCLAALQQPSHFVVGVARHPATVQHPQYSHVTMDLGDAAGLADHDAVAQVFASVPRDFGCVVLVNNAAQMVTAYVGRAEPQALVAAMTCSVVAPVVLCNAFVQRFQGAPGSKVVVNVSGSASNFNYDGWAAYCASKAAVDRFSQVMQAEQELSRSGIRVFAVHPGVVQTDMLAAARSSPEPNYFARLRASNPQASVHEYTAESMARRLLRLAEAPEQYPDVIVKARDILEW